MQLVESTFAHALNGELKLSPKELELLAERVAKAIAAQHGTAEPGTKAGEAYPEKQVLEIPGDSITGDSSDADAAHQGSQTETLGRARGMRGSRGRARGTRGRARGSRAVVTSIDVVTETPEDVTGTLGRARGMRGSRGRPRGTRGIRGRVTGFDTNAPGIAGTTRRPKRNAIDPRIRDQALCDANEIARERQRKQE